VFITIVYHKNSRLIPLFGLSKYTFQIYRLVTCSITHLKFQQPVHSNE